MDSISYNQVLDDIINDNVSNDINRLIEVGLVVDNSLDEFEEYLNSEVLCDDCSNSHMNIHILPTTGCNFACPYCYQDGIASKTFSKEDVSPIMENIKSYCKGHAAVSTITLTLFGGEPTLNWLFVELFLEQFDSACCSMDIDYSIQIVTNGYLLDRKKLATLQKYKCDRMQITLDGTREKHNSRRCLKDNSETFDTIINNIHCALNEKYINQVHIRLNYDISNIPELEELMQYLASELDTKQIVLSFGWISNTVPTSKSSSFVASHIVNGEKQIKAFMKLYHHAKFLGFQMNNFYLSNGQCIAKKDNSIIICPDGHYYKCEGLIGRDNCTIGNISDPIPTHNYFFKDLYESCIRKKCRFLPLCHTGCRLEAYAASGNIHSIDCKYDVIKGINEEILRDYL